jgi:hypothetical protein
VNLECREAVGSAPRRQQRESELPHRFEVDCAFSHQAGMLHQQGSNLFSHRPSYFLGQSPRRNAFAVSTNP